MAASQVINGVIGEDDAKVVTAPLMHQREVARLRLAALPSANAGRSFGNVSPEKCRAKLMEAWSDRSMEERRDALRGLLDKVVLHDGGMEIHYAMRAYCEDGWQGPSRRT